MLIYLALAILGFILLSYLGVFAWAGGLFAGVVLGEIFLFGTFWFWILMLAMCAGVIWLIDEDLDNDYTPEWTGAPFGVFVVVAVLLQFFGDIPVFTLIGAHPWKTLMWVLAYAVCGAAYSLGRWAWFVFVQRPMKYRDEKEKFFAANGIKDEIPAYLKSSWEIDVLCYAKKVNARDYKGWLIKLMAYWPWSAFWFLISAFIKRMFRNLYELLQGWYDEMAESAWRRMEKEVSQVKFKSEDTDENRH